jgi:hypothetical protein
MVNTLIAAEKVVVNIDKHRFPPLFGDFDLSPSIQRLEEYIQVASALRLIFKIIPG